MNALLLRERIVAVLFASVFLFASGCAKPSGASNPVTPHSPLAQKELADYDLSVDLEGESRAEEVRGEGRALVDKCAAQVGEGNGCLVSSYKTVLGEEARCMVGEGDANQQAYYLSRQEDGIHVVLNIHFDVDSKQTTDARAEEMLSNIRACRTKLQLFFLRYNLHLDLGIDRNVPETPVQIDHVIDLIDGNGHTVSNRYYYDDYERFMEYSDSSRREVFCRAMLHEVGHLLSFPDEYEASEEEMKKLGEKTRFISTDTKPWSIMAADDHHWEAIDFYPRHIRKLISPMCNSKDLE